MSVTVKSNSSPFLMSEDKMVANPVLGVPKRSYRLVTPVVAWLSTGQNTIPGSLTSFLRLVQSEYSGLLSKVFEGSIESAECLLP